MLLIPTIQRINTRQDDFPPAIARTTYVCIEYLPFSTPPPPPTTSLYRDTIFLQPRFRMSARTKHHNWRHLIQTTERAYFAVGACKKLKEHFSAMTIQDVRQKGYALESAVYAKATSRSNYRATIARIFENLQKGLYRDASHAISDV